MKSTILKIFLCVLALSPASCARHAELKGRIVFEAPPKDVYMVGRDRIKVISEGEMAGFIKVVEDRSRNSPDYFGSFRVAELSKLKVLEEAGTDVFLTLRN